MLMLLVSKSLLLTKLGPYNGVLIYAAAAGKKAGD
jgi:hypothetical protein